MLAELSNVQDKGITEQLKILQDAITNITQNASDSNKEGFESVSREVNKFTI